MIFLPVCVGILAFDVEESFLKFINDSRLTCIFKSGRLAMRANDCQGNEIEQKQQSHAAEGHHRHLADQPAGG